MCKVLANAMAWEQGWKADPTGPVDWDRVNVSGSSIAVGAILGRPPAGALSPPSPMIMARQERPAGAYQHLRGCGMAGAMVLERD